MGICLPKRLQLTVGGIKWTVPKQVNRLEHGYYKIPIKITGTKNSEGKITDEIEFTLRDRGKKQGVSTLYLNKFEQ
jgi:hypothetical protein